MARIEGRITLAGPIRKLTLCLIGLPPRMEFLRSRNYGLRNRLSQNQTGAKTSVVFHVPHFHYASEAKANAHARHDIVLRLEESATLRFGLADKKSQTSPRRNLATRYSRSGLSQRWYISLLSQIQSAAGREVALPQRAEGAYRPWDFRAEDTLQGFFVLKAMIAGCFSWMNRIATCLASPDCCANSHYKV